MTKLIYPGPHAAVTVPDLGTVPRGEIVGVDNPDLAARLREQGWTDGTNEPAQPPAGATDPPDPDAVGKPTRSRAGRRD